MFGPLGFILQNIFQNIRQKMTLTLASAAVQLDSLNATLPEP